ncbi:aldose 1-epimerase family protein [Parapedobacter sp. 10938]|uniref:aldose 1-epimerase family protein n=1 Tax=Parapedobacter flavus TaxID=3110225 RepID=UPI002DBA97E2|nr:aldose 1-epimerase family protein [Parapedobacter sp. 10938]MEC3879035.1 aldose 1-epimerase family protein [Parapedobacter sp. 10938]
MGNGRITNWAKKVSNPLQVGGIETAVLDNGAAKGTRVAWINTGAGLRYKVVIDRGMDIADAQYNAHSLAWLSHVGITAPAHRPYRGIEWLNAFGGGLLTTCGLDHIGGPESDANGERGLHSQYSGIPATIESIIQPDPAIGQLDMQITGVVKQSQPLGAQFTLRRTISCRLGEAAIRIDDEVINTGNIPAPHMLLYHMNLGWPLVDEDVDICWQGPWTSREGKDKAKIFREGSPFKKGKPPLEDHVGIGEEAAFIDIAADQDGMCHCGIHNPHLGIALAIEFKKSQLPWMTNWQHWGPGEYVVGIEPGTHPPIGQSNARRDGSLIVLQPNERRHYGVTVRVHDNPEEIAAFLQQTANTH